MEEQTLRYQTLTPMFITGGVPDKSEFRVPSMKGVMHYWWRAVQHANNLDTMRNLEAQLFGSSDTSIGKSKFKLIATKVNRTNRENAREAMLPNEIESQAKAKSPCFKGSFDIKLVSRNPMVFKRAVAVAELSAILGGLGKRNRRGFGSYYLVPNQVDGQKKEGDINAFADRISSLLSKITPHNIICMQKNNEILFQFAPFTNFEKLQFNCPSILEIVVKQTAQKLENILQFIRKKSHDYAAPKFLKACGHIKPTRQASPICFSFYKYNDIDYIVTTLLSSSINSDRANDIKIQKNFRDEVLRDA